jgi:hypothetical protein
MKGEIKMKPLPPVKLDHIKALTDDTGILQHTKFAIPKRSQGYTTDDNSRALITCIKYNKIYHDSAIEKLVDIYLSFLLHMQKSDGKLHNFLSYDRHFLDLVGSEDSMGRTLWACGYTINSTLTKEKKLVAKEIFDKTLPWIHGFTSPRAKAFALMGLYFYQKTYYGDKNLILNIKKVANQLLNHYKDASSRDWHWFEAYLTYANARLPQALFKAYQSTGKDKLLQVAKESLDFLIQGQIINGVFIPVGNKGWYKKGGKKALYDQQPVEASCMVETVLKAFQITKNEQYNRMAHTIFDWFLGVNSQNAMIYNPETGGCYDGITPKGINLNQGTEATLCYLLARLEFDMLK